VGRLRAIPLIVSAADSGRGKTEDLARPTTAALACHAAVHDCESCGVVEDPLLAGVAGAASRNT
jgi:hypothetical protein